MNPEKPKSKLFKVPAKHEERGKGISSRVYMECPQGRTRSPKSAGAALEPSYVMSFCLGGRWMFRTTHFTIQSMPSFTPSLCQNKYALYFSQPSTQKGKRAAIKPAELLFRPRWCDTLVRAQLGIKLKRCSWIPQAFRNAAISMYKHWTFTLEYLLMEMFDFVSVCSQRTHLFFLLIPLTLANLKCRKFNMSVKIVTCNVNYLKMLALNRHRINKYNREGESTEWGCARFQACSTVTGAQSEKGRDLGRAHLDLWVFCISSTCIFSSSTTNNNFEQLLLYKLNLMSFTRQMFLTGVLYWIIFDMCCCIPSV